jgi:hypothetical protein
MTVILFGNFYGPDFKMLNIKVYKTVLTVVLHRCVTWALPLRVQHKLQVFENKVLRKICLRRVK